MADLSQIKLPNGTTYDLKDAKVRKRADIYYVEGPSTNTTAGQWTGSIEGLTAYTDGLTVLYVPAVAGAATTTLNLNGLGAKTCYVTNANKLTTHFSAGTPILLTYVDGAWKRADWYPTYSAGTGISLSGTTINHSNSVAAGTAGTSSATSGSTLAVPYVTYDAQGHVTGSGTHTHTVSGFVATSQGAANAGKFLVVNSSGNVAAVSMAVWQGGAY